VGGMVNKSKGLLSTDYTDKYEFMSKNNFTQKAVGVMRQVDLIAQFDNEEKMDKFFAFV